MVQTQRDAEGSLAEIEGRIARFGDLAPDWDSYGAKTISPTAIVAAQDLLRALTKQTASAIGEQVLNAWVAPLPNGDIVLEWHGPRADLEVEVTADGSLDILLEERVGERGETIERANVAFDEVAALLSRVLLA